MRARTDAAAARQRPGGRWRRVLLLLAPFVLLANAGCTSLAFAVANVPARLSDVQRTAGIAYGTQPRQRLDVYQPAHAAPAPRPIVVFFYGGAWNSGARSQYRFVGAALAQLGYVTVLADYRLYPQVRFPAFIDDGAQVVAWAMRHAGDYGADGTRIVLAGHSAGAHLAAMLAVAPEPLAGVGVARQRIAGLIGLSGPYDLRPDTPTLNTIFAAPYGPSDWQVIARVQGPVPPALLLHGADDRRVWPRASALLAERLRAAGGQVTLRDYAHCTHACTVAALSVVARRKAPVLADVRDFLERLGPTE